MKVALFLPVLFLTLLPVEARQDPVICGTNAELTKKEIYLSRQAAQMRSRESGARRHSTGAAQGRIRTAARDIGNLAILEDAEGVVTRQNAFDLESKTVLFSPTAANAARYRFETRAGDYNEGLANNPGPHRQVLDLDDDDTREIPLNDFSFPFFGNSYRSVFINSDGNLTFGTGDGSSSRRSFRAFVSGPPRIAGLYTDLDPTMSRAEISVVSENWRLTVSWVAVPEYTDFGTGRPQTFQIRLYPDGRIELAWSSIDLSEAVAGIAPGRSQGSSSIVSFANAVSAEYSSAVGEPFTAVQEIDVLAAAQKFYETHDDSYDYLVVYNTMGVRSCEGAVACEITVRNNRTGFGDRLVDVGSELGSPRRLQAFMNMGPLSQYPADPNQAIGGRGQITGDTALTILAHEAGHLFLAFASVADPFNASATPMLSPDGAHWAFTFNSEASLLEGNRIRDDGEGASPRFTTVAVNEGYSLLDQYLMGLRPAHEVPPTFYVRRSSGFNQFPQVGVTMNGERRDVTIEDIIKAEGRRTPDETVSQRHFNFAFIVIVPEGTQPTAGQLQQVDTYRREFEAYFRRATGERASADTSLRRSLLLSTSPASGVLAGGSANATVSIKSPAPSPVMVDLRTTKGAASVPPSVVIPAGATQEVFQITGIRPGVEELTARVADPAYESAEARIQVSSPASGVKLVVVSGDKQPANLGAPLASPVILRVTDVNNLPYSGVRVAAGVSAGGTLDPPVAVSDENGVVQFRWTASSSVLNELRAAIEGAPDSSALIVTALGRPAFEANSVVNAASFAPGLTPGSLATVFGANLAAGNTASARLPLPSNLMGVRVTVNGAPARLVYISDRQINFFVPSDLPVGPADVVVSNTLGTSAVQRVNVLAITPGIFFDVASGFGAILVAGTGQTTIERGAAAGEFLEIYSTGLGGVQANGRTLAIPLVKVGGVHAQVTFSGLAPGFIGLYQVNAQVPADLAAGIQPVTLDVNGTPSNSVNVRLR